MTDLNDAALKTFSKLQLLEQILTTIINLPKTQSTPLLRSLSFFPSPQNHSFFPNRFSLWVSVTAASLLMAKQPVRVLVTGAAGITLQSLSDLFISLTDSSLIQLEIIWSRSDYRSLVWYAIGVYLFLPISTSVHLFGFDSRSLICKLVDHAWYVISVCSCSSLFCNSISPISITV